MHVSFRNRLTFFFLLLVILPVIAVGIVGILIVRDAEETANDLRLGSAQTAAAALWRELAGERRGGGADVRAGRLDRRGDPRR